MGTLLLLRAGNRPDFHRPLPGDGRDCRRQVAGVVLSRGVLQSETVDSPRDVKHVSTRPFLSRNQEHLDVARIWSSGLPPIATKGWLVPGSERAGLGLTGPRILFVKLVRDFRLRFTAIPSQNGKKKNFRNHLQVTRSYGPRRRIGWQGRNKQFPHRTSTTGIRFVFAGGRNSGAGHHGGLPSGDPSSS